MIMNIDDGDILLDEVELCNHVEMFSRRLFAAYLVYRGDQEKDR